MATVNNATTALTFTSDNSHLDSISNLISKGQFREAVNAISQMPTNTLNQNATREKLLEDLLSKAIEENQVSLVLAQLRNQNIAPTNESFLSNFIFSLVDESRFSDAKLINRTLVKDQTCRSLQTECIQKSQKVANLLAHNKLKEAVGALSEIPTSTDKQSTLRDRCIINVLSKSLEHQRVPQGLAYLKNKNITCKNENLLNDFILKLIKSNQFKAAGLISKALVCDIETSTHHAQLIHVPILKDKAIKLINHNEFQLATDTIAQIPTDSDDRQKIRDKLIEKLLTQAVKEKETSVALEFINSKQITYTNQSALCVFIRELIYKKKYSPALLVTQALVKDQSTQNSMAQLIRISQRTAHSNNTTHRPNPFTAGTEREAAELFQDCQEALRGLAHAEEQLRSAANAASEQNPSLKDTLTNLADQMEVIQLDSQELQKKIDADFAKY